MDWLKCYGKPSTGPQTLRRRVMRLEPLESRLLLAVPTLGDLPDEITLLAGAPLHIALDGFDADGDSLTYSTENTASGLSVIIPKQVVTGGNRSLRMTVSHRLGTDTPDDPSDDQTVSFGTMEFELFEERASRATSRIIDLAESGWYDGKLFHRVISGFMIQGGSLDGYGQFGTGETFDDQFHPTLQHTSAGLLSMAKAGDDTNDSQFFITDAATRWLDFNYTVFGLLTSGNDVRAAISAVPVGTSDRPLNDVVIESVEVFYDREDAAMMLAAPEGVSGDADVTVRVSDGNGGTAQRTIHVVVEPDTSNGNPYLQDIDPIWVDFDTPLEFSLGAVDVEGDQVFFAGEAYPATNDLDVIVSSAGQVIITPKNGEFGAYTVAFDVGPADNNMQDSQIVPVFVRPPAPIVELTPLSDTGDRDGVTAINNGEYALGFVVSGVAPDGNVWLETGGVVLPTDEVSRTLADDGSGNYDVLLELTGDQLADGVYEYRAGQSVILTGENAGVNLTSDLSGLLPVTVDTSDPLIVSTAVQSASVGEEYRYQVQATDGDNTDIRYEIQTPYAGMQQDPVTGAITWTPSATQAGIRPLVLFAIDGAGNAGRQEFNIEVFFTLGWQGVVDFAEFAGLDLTDGELNLGFDAMHSGELTLEIVNPQPPESALVKLFDHDPVTNPDLSPLATSTLVNGNQRIDRTVVANETYYVQLFGANSDSVFRVANLLHHDASSSIVTVHGTDSNDRFEFDAAASRDVIVNGVRYQFDDAQVKTVTFDGGDGYDTVVLDDSPGDDTLTAEAKHAVFSNSDQTPGFTVTLNGFEELHAYARSGGHNEAILHDSDGKDKFKSEPAENYAKMYGGRMYNRVKFFDTVEAFSSGEKDLARLFDTQGNDVFEGRQDVSWLRTDVLDVGVHNFCQVIAQAKHGGNDVATLKDSAREDEVHLKGHKSEIFDQQTKGEIYKITARRFDTVHADGSQGAGYDKVKAWETARDNHVEAADNWARMFAQKVELEMVFDILAFEFVKVRSSTGGNDTANVTEPLDFDLLFEDGWGV